MNAIFIHVPKAAGSTIQKALKSQNYDLPTCLHKKVTSYPEKTRENSFVFSFVRNPFDRIVSGYHYLTGGFCGRADADFGKTLPATFEGFIKNIDAYINRLHFRPMTFWLDDEIDFIGRFESFHRDFNIVCDRIKIPRQQLPHHNKSQHRHYTEYYDNETIEIVSKKYAKDIELFGYSFE